MKLFGRVLALLLIAAGWAAGVTPPRAPAAPPTFTEVDHGISGLLGGEVRWGDYDSDGHLDLAMAGTDAGGRWTRLYRNDLAGSGNFVEHPDNAGLLGLNEGPVILGDYDNDGDLDLAYGGWSGGGTGNRIIRNDGAGGLTWLNNGLRGMKGADGAWFDYDNDGDLDLILVGESYDPPQADYSQIYRNDGNGVFSLTVGLPGVYLGQVSVGDYNNDGRLDLIIVGRTVGAKIFRNDGGDSFTDIVAGLPGLINSAVAWGDYDNDGLLDFAICGQKGDNSLYFEIYHNDGGGTFTAINAGLPGVHTGELRWGDYDNDGDLDLLVTGIDGVGTILSRVYRNDAGTFVDANLGLTGVWNQASAAWGDYDNDGRLDIILGGATPGGSAIKLYHNTGGPANTAPTAPGAPGATANGNRITFAWAASTDAQTPTPGLTYNLRVGTSPGGQQVMAAHADLATGYRRLPEMGNVQHNLQWTLQNLAPGTYYYAVQAVDTGFMGGAWSSEQSITVIAPPKVAATVPAPGATLLSAPTLLTATLSAPIDPATVTPATVRLIWGGPDGAIGTGDDVAVVPAGVTLSGGNQIQIDLTGVRLPNGPYRIFISGTAAADPVAIGQWSLDEASGTTAVDSSGSGFNGTLVNGPTRIAGKTGNALHFNGVDQNVDIPDTDLLSPHVGPAGAMSLSAWVRISALPPAGPPSAIVVKGSDLNWEYGLFLYPDGSLSFSMMQSDGTPYAEAHGGLLTTGVWHHLAGTMKKGESVKIFLDGIALDNRLNFGGDTSNGSSSFRIGSAGPSTPSFFLGDVDDVRLFDRDLAPVEVRNLSALGGALRGTSGQILDGEFGGTFPSGNGSPGGDYLATFTLAVPPLQVTAMVPAPGTALTSAPADITLTLSGTIDGETVNASSVKLIRAGTDGTLGTGDDVVLTPSSVALLSPNQIRIALAAVPMPPDIYGVILRGNASSLSGRVNSWTLDEGIGDAAADSAGAVSGAIVGPVWVPGRTGNALHYNGISDRVVFGAPPLAPPWTAGVWVKREDSPSGDARIMDPEVFSGGSLRLESFPNTNRVGLGVYTVGDFPSGYTAPVGQWVHLTFVGTAVDTRLYVNGAYADTMSASISVPRFYLGSHGYNTMLGAIDDFQVFGRDLTDLEIAQLASFGGAIRDQNGNRLDGEYTGSLPSGNATTGGDYLATFSIGTPLPPAPGAFALTLPADAASGVSVSPTFSWTPSTGVAGYTLQMATDPGFGTLVVNQSGIVATSFALPGPLNPSTLYYWRVIASNGGGNTNATVAPFSFTTSAAQSSLVSVDLRAGGCGLSGLELLLPAALWLLRRRLRSA